MSAILDLTAFFIQWAWERKIQIVLKKFALGGWEKLKQGQFQGRCIVLKGELFIASGLVVGSSLESSCMSRMW